MKTIKKMMAITSLVALSVTLFSFSVPKGGEGFRIYLDNKLVLQQFGSQMNDVKTISLDKKSSSGQLSVEYFHCGQIAKNRTIAIKDANNRTLKEWKFADVSTGNVSFTDPSMSCKVADIVSLQKNNTGKLSLYYSSSELPKGRVLATIVSGTGNLARN